MSTMIKQPKLRDTALSTKKHSAGKNQQIPNTTRSKEFNKLERTTTKLTKNKETARNKKK